MQYLVSAVAFAAVAAALPQGVTESLSPDSSAPEGCEDNYSGDFQIQVTNVTTSATKRDLSKRQQAEADELRITLADGVLTDSQDRTGYIAANNQFQFDAPPQTGAIYTAGWSVCSNGSLALGGSNVFYQCLTGNPTGPGNFYNLYDEAQGDQCGEVTINVVGFSGSGGSASQAADGQVTETPVSSAAGVSQIGDGQVQATTSGAPVSQISDGQIQASTSGAPVSQISDGQIQASTGAPVSQIPDGQIQASTGAPVSQIPDGQIQASTAAPEPTGAPVSQIPDGQIQASTAAPEVSQIPDGQVQAPFPSGNGTAPPAPEGTGAQTPVTPFDGAANSLSVAGAAALLAALGFVAAL